MFLKIFFGGECRQMIFETATVCLHDLLRTSSALGGMCY